MIPRVRSVEPSSIETISKLREQRWRTRLSSVRPIWRSSLCDRITILIAGAIGLPSGYFASAPNEASAASTESKISKIR